MSEYESMAPKYAVPVKIMEGGITLDMLTEEARQQLIEETAAAVNQVTDVSDAFHFDDSVVSSEYRQVNAYTIGNVLYFSLSFSVIGDTEDAYGAVGTTDLPPSSYDKTYGVTFGDPAGHNGSLIIGLDGTISVVKSNDGSSATYPNNGDWIAIAGSYLFQDPSDNDDTE